MKIEVTQELTDLFARILAENKTESEWAEIESDDMFQSDHYSGGFDATEMAFCFSFFDEDGIEFWFQIPLEEIREYATHGKAEIDAHLAG